MVAISRVRHTSKYGCLALCRDKEALGFECIRPIEQVNKTYKHFNKRGKFLFTEEDEYYEAIYRKG
ncbi:hypothetical protein [Oceanobacillus kimchii]|uniref:hypothetical protein n=1 Tax=Oceanobacillus kimchii TaxID=746691 RepID=UPI003B02B8F5